MPAELLIAMAVALVLVTGVNDGGALLAPGLRVPALPVLPSLAILTAAVVMVPLLVTTAVADTMVNSFVPADDDGATALAVGFLAAVGVVLALARASLPTSLTLAIIGGIAGAGAGVGLDVGWSAIVRVLVIGLAAPVVGAVLALTGALIWRTWRSANYLSAVRRGHVMAFVTQCVAYGANDGQKMFVLFMAAAIASGDDQSIVWWAYPVVAAGFAVGSFLGLPQAARSVGTGIVNTRPTHAVTAEFSAAAAVLGSAAIGTPVSMTQAIAGGLVGAGVHESVRRVRWRVARNLAVAWIVTLPFSFAVAGLIGLVIRAATQ